MFVAVEPMTETVAGQVVHHPVGAPLIRWHHFSGAVRRALINHGTVRECVDAPDLARDLEPEEELPVEGDRPGYANDDFDDDVPDDATDDADDEDDEDDGPVECRKVSAEGDGFPCKQCDGKTFPTKRSLSQHVRWAHKSET